MTKRSNSSEAIFQAGAFFGAADAIDKVSDVLEAADMKPETRAIVKAHLTRIVNDYMTAARKAGIDVDSPMPLGKA